MFRFLTTASGEKAQPPPEKPKPKQPDKRQYNKDYDKNKQIRRFDPAWARTNE